MTLCITYTKKQESHFADIMALLVKQLTQNIPESEHWPLEDQMNYLQPEKQRQGNII